MGIFDLIEALIKLGLPIVVITWLMFSWLYGSGEIDREADNRAVKQRLKKMKTSFKKRKHKAQTLFITHGCGSAAGSMPWLHCGHFPLLQSPTSTVSYSAFLFFPCYFMLASSDLFFL